MDSAPVVLSRQEILHASKSQDWEVLWIDLLTHTILRLRIRYGLKGKPDEIRDKARAHLSSTMELILVKGDRNWNTERYVTFRDFVVSVIDSYLSNQFAKEEISNESLDLVPEIS